MIFPELVERARGFLERRAGTPSLGLKASGFSDPAWLNYNGFRRTAEGYDEGVTYSGEQVNRHSALNHSVVFACNRLISEPTGFLPLLMMQRSKTGKRIAIDHPMFSALHDEPNAETTAQEFRETRTSNCVLGGNGFAQIIRRSGGDKTAIELHALNPDQVHIDRDSQNRLVYVVGNSTAAGKTWTVERNTPQDILHIRGIGWDGMRGYSVLSVARQSIGIGLSAERNVGRFYANGGRVPYHLEMAKRFGNDSDFDKFRADWEKTYSQPHKVPILENGTTLKQDGMSMADAQMLETRVFTVAELCRWFGVSPDLAGDLSRATFANMEHLGLRFVTFTAGPWFTRWEQALKRCVLTPEEKAKGYYFRFNVNALLRGDFLSRMAGYASAIQNGHLNQDEVRDFEDMNPLPNSEGSHYRVQLNMQTLTADGATGNTDPATAELTRRARNER